MVPVPYGTVHVPYRTVPYGTVPHGQNGDCTVPVRYGTIRYNNASPRRITKNRNNICSNGRYIHICQISRYNKMSLLSDWSPGCDGRIDFMSHVGFLTRVPWLIWGGLSRSSPSVPPPRGPGQVLRGLALAPGTVVVRRRDPSIGLFPVTDCLRKYRYFWKYRCVKKYRYFWKYRCVKKNRYLVLHNYLPTSIHTNVSITSWYITNVFDTCIDTNLDISI